MISVMTALFVPAHSWNLFSATPCATSSRVWVPAEYSKAAWTCCANRQKSSITVSLPQ